MTDSKLPENDDHIFFVDVPASEPVSKRESSFHRPVLKGSLIGAGVTTALVIVSAVLVNTAQTNSSFQTIAVVVNRVFMFLMLTAFFGIFVAYQIPKIVKFYSKRLGGRTDFLPPRPRESGFILQPGIAMPPVVTHKRRDHENLDLIVLVCVNLGLLVLTWVGGVMLYQFGLASLLALILSPLAAIIPGLLITMIVWHRGVVRAYAIGALPALVGHFVMASVLQTIFYSGGYYQGGGMPGVANNYFISLGSGFTLAMFSGLACAVYVRIVEVVRYKRSQAQATDPSSDA